MQLNDLNERAAYAVNISDLFSLLSIGFKSPSRELAAGLWDNSFFHDMNACLESLGLDHISYHPIANDADDLYHQINQEYTRLFLAPWNEKVILTEGAFLHGKKTAQFINESALHAEQCYRHSLYLFEEKGALPGDHISVEFGFLAFLYANLGLALQAERADLVEKSQQAIQLFSQMHLQRWLHSFMKSVSTETSNTFYQALARIGLQLDNLSILQ